MHSGGLIKKCLDKPVCTVLCHSINFLPSLTLQKHFTFVINDIFKKDGYNPSLEIKHELKDYAIGFTSTINIFMQIFQIDRSKAKSIVLRNPLLRHVSRKTILQNYENLKKAGLNCQLIENNVLLLTEDTDILEKKITSIKKVTDVNSGISLFHHSSSDLKNLVDVIDYSNKINGHESVECKLKFIEKKWQIKNKELCDIISKFLLYIILSPENTIKVIKLLLDYNVSVYHLLNKNWPVFCDHTKLKKRLKNCSNVGIFKIGPWVLKDESNIFFERIMKVNDSNKRKERISKFVRLLNENSSYTIKLINYRIVKCQVKPPKIKDAKVIVDTILKEGYTWDDIIWSIKIFNVPQSLIIKRFLELNKNGCRAPYLDILLLSEKDFTDYVHNNRKE